MGVIVQFLGGVIDLIPGKAAILGETDMIVASLQGLEDQLSNLVHNRVFVYTAGCFVAYKAWGALFAPLQHIRRNPDVGYIVDSKQHKLERANEVRRRRQTGDLPPVYPNGWYCIMPSHELPPKGFIFVVFIYSLLVINFP
jgi:hypothetical protein